MMTSSPIFSLDQFVIKRRSIRHLVPSSDKQHKQRSDCADSQADTCICCSSQFEAVDMHGYRKYISSVQVII